MIEEEEEEGKLKGKKKRKGKQRWGEMVFGVSCVIIKRTYKSGPPSLNARERERACLVSCYFAPTA